MSTSLANLNINQTSANQGTGIDVTSVVDQIIYSEQAPERIWQQQQVSLATQASSLNSLSSGLQALQTQLFSLTDLAGSFSSQMVSSSQPGIVTASVQSGAANGVHSLVVQNLATVSSYYTDPVASSSTTLASGTISVRVGAASHDITIDSSNNTLDKLATYINSQDYGVQASVINDASGARLALVSKTSGAAGDLNVTANSTGLKFHKSAAGVDAQFTVDGVPLTSGTNTVASAIPGVTLNLLSAAPSTPVTLTVAANTAAATQAISNFVSAYNSVMTAVNSQFKADANSSAGPLASNSALRSLQSSLLSDATFSIAGNNGIVNLASLGVDMANDGTLSVDTAKLNDSLTNHFAAVQNFFQSVSSDGFATNVKSNLKSLVDPSSGLMALNLNENTSNQKMLSQMINDFEDRLTLRRQLLTTQYSQVDAMLRAYPLMIQQIQAQINSIQSTSK
jgi:flagellar hook-associated protein 2